MDQVRGDRPRDLILKHDAPIIRAERLLEPRRRLNVEAIEHPDRWALITATKQAAKRGEIRILSTVPTYDFGRGTYQVKVIRLKSPAPRWRRPLLITLAVLAPMALLLGLIWWVITSLSATAVMVMLGCTMLYLIGGLFAGRTTNKTINIDIRQ